MYIKQSPSNLKWGHQQTLLLKWCLEYWEEFRYTLGWSQAMTKWRTLSSPSLEAGIEASCTHTHLMKDLPQRQCKTGEGSSQVHRCRSLVEEMGVGSYHCRENGLVQECITIHIQCTSCTLHTVSAPKQRHDTFCYYMYIKRRIHCY